MPRNAKPVVSGDTSPIVTPSPITPLPASVEAEQTVIGSVLVDNKIWPKVRQILAPEDFAEPAHQALWRIIEERIASGRRADHLTIKRAAASDPAIGVLGGHQYVMIIAKTAETTIAAVEYAWMVADLAAKRRLLELAERVRHNALNGGMARDVMREARAQLDALAEESPVARATLSAVDFHAFLAGHRPPDYVVRGVIQRSYLYSLTGRTGHGKTAVALRIAIAIARGEPLGPHDVEPGHVLYLAAENPDDIRSRLLLAVEHLGLQQPLPIQFIDRPFDLKTRTDELLASLARSGPFSVVFVDTGPAFLAASGGEDENANMEMYRFAQAQRRLIDLPGRPAVISLMHPVKHANEEHSLLPRGGGAYLAEVDGNLTVWADDDRSSTKLSWCGKLRGPAFEPITFRLQTATCPALRDTSGRPIYTVLAEPMTDDDTAARDHEQADRETRLLITIARNPTATERELAILANLPGGGTTHRLVARLIEDGLVKRILNRLELTQNGSKAVSRILGQ